MNIGSTVRYWLEYIFWVHLTGNFMRLKELLILSAAAISPISTVALENISQTEIQGENPCLSTDPALGDSAFWASKAVEQFADAKFTDAVSTVDACFAQWGPDAGQQQKKLHKKRNSCPPTGKVKARIKRKIEKNYLMNDVSMALWAKARSHHELGQIDLAKQTYGQCVYMICGRAWDPKGWFWSPAKDCADKARALLK